MSELSKSLARVLEESKDWERKRTSLPGVFVVKAPASRNRPSQLLVEINPVNSAGIPTKRRGLYIRSLGELEEYRRIINNRELERLLKAMEEVNPKVEEGERGVEEEIEL